MLRPACLLVALIPVAATAQTLDDRAAVDAVVDAFYAGDVAPLWQASTPEMQAVFGDEIGLATFQSQLSRQLGDPVAAVSADESAAEGLRFYSRLTRFALTDALFSTLVAVDAQGKVAGFLVEQQQLAAESAYLDYQTTADLALPVTGEWLVVWGGRTLAQNYHATDKGQRFALDLVKVAGEAHHSGDGAALADYHCWGAPIAAPAAGRVVAAVNDLEDQQIGSRDPDHPAGNHVVLELGPAEYLFLAHFQQGSVTVAAGDLVAAGDVLGLCGNSGNTTEPHLHMHLQTTPVFGGGEGLPMQFRNYRAGDALVPHGEPLQGQVISPAP